MAAGLAFAIACDFRLSTPESKLDFPKSRLGIRSANGGIQRLVSQVGSSLAKELVMAGERVSARSAESDGFIDRITTGASLAIRVAKDSIDTGLGTDQETAIRYEHQASRALRETRDHEQGGNGRSMRIESLSDSESEAVTWLSV
nr:enoyl-CoA hydratase-related protein [Halostagnicola kamekurae]